MEIGPLRLFENTAFLAGLEALINVKSCGRCWNALFKRIIYEVRGVKGGAFPMEFRLYN